MGLTSMVLANFSRRPVFAYRLMIATTLLIGLLGIVVWGHHMFVAGLNPFAGTAFSRRLARHRHPRHRQGPQLDRHHLALAAPTSPRRCSSRSASSRSSSPEASAGPILAQPILDEYLHNTFFVVAHFHLIMAMAGAFGLFCGLYYWAPLIFGRRLNETLGKVHFWGTLFFAYNTFLPMHLTGLASEPRHYAQLGGIAPPANALLLATLPLQRHITTSALLLAAFQLPFLLNLLLLLRKPHDDTPTHGKPPPSSGRHQQPCRARLRPHPSWRTVCHASTASQTIPSHHNGNLSPFRSTKHP